MAETVHLYLKANGNDITGDSSQTSLDREGSIECLYVKDAVRTAREKGSALATGRRTYEPFELRKRIDQSSPLLAKALCMNEVVEGVFKFFRPNPDGDGTTQHFFTIEIAEGRIASIERESPDTLDPAASLCPPVETIKIVYGKITWIYEPDGKMHSDDWKTGGE